MMNKIFLMLSLFLSLYMNSQKENKNKIDLKQGNAILDSYIKNQIAKEKPKPVEYKSARKIMFYDFDSDGDNDLYAFFTLEGFGGGNNWQHYIAIFEIENNLVKAVDDMVLYGDSLKEYNNGEFLKFSNGYVYFRLYGYDWKTQEKFIKTIGFTLYQKKIVTDKKY